MASQQELKKRLKALMNRPENQTCSDCPEKQPRWASLIVPPPGSPPGSLPIGAFCCLECSGSHRRLGVHISFVRSVNLDQWKEREVQAMENGGNKKVNLIFEAKLGPYSDTRKPNTGASGSERERFIRDKYERRKFYDPSVLQQYLQGGSDEDDSDSEEESPKKSRGSPVVRAPSDAARRRAETRRARLAATQAPAEAARPAGAKPKIIAPRKQSKPAPVPAPAPAPAPAPEVDLLDFSAPAPAPQAEAPAPPSAPASPKLDLFANMKISNGDIQNASDAAASTVQSKTTAEQRKMKNDEILAMFNTAPTQQAPPAFGDFSAFNSMKAGGGTNPGAAAAVKNMGTGGGMVMMNAPANGMVMMGGAPGAGMGFPQQGNILAQQQARNMMMMQQNAIGNTTMMMQQRTDSGINTMMMQQQGGSMGGNPMGQNSMPVNEGFSMTGNGMGGMGMGMAAPPMSPQQQPNTMGNQMLMGGMSPSSSAANQLMGGQPMGGQLMGGQPMGGQVMGNIHGKPQSDKFSEFSPW